MSFYTYYGKLKDDLFVAVLPNGTVELDDPVHVYSHKRLITYQVRDVDVTEDGEDRFVFQDGYYTFEATTSKAYKTISLTRTCRSGGEVATVTLTRHYDQPQTATSASSRPRVWTGTIDFHDWAKNESFIVIAPQGLGNTKGVVAMWQWTKDNKGVAGTLSYGVSKQSSDAQTPEKFSFKQNEYYTLDCQMNAATKGLNVTVKGPTNAAKAQKELVLAPQTEGAEHRFAPPRARQEKLSFECSLPNAKPSLPRINAALPFPADLVETLSYSAAYVDQAGYLAKYAVKQFEKLDRSYHLLEKKAEARATKVAKLEGDISGLNAEVQTLNKRNTDLEAQIANERKSAAKEKADLQEALRKAATAGQQWEDRADALEKENTKLRKYIAKDKLADIERERVHEKHEKEDHRAIDIAHDRLHKAEDLAKSLKDELNGKNKTISELRSSLDATKCQLKSAEAETVRLTGDLTKVKKQKAEIQTKLDDATHKLSVAEQDIAHLRTELANTKTELSSEQKTKAELQQKLEKTASELVDAKEEVDSLEIDIAEKVEVLKKQQKEVEDLSDTLRETEEALKSTQIAKSGIESSLEEAQAALVKSQVTLKNSQHAEKETQDAHRMAMATRDGLRKDLKTVTEAKESAVAKARELEKQIKAFSKSLPAKAEPTVTVAEVRVV
jgi:predicted  nucleic acid-binding Zn-ribbon protein